MQNAMEELFYVGHYLLWWARPKAAFLLIFDGNSIQSSHKAEMKIVESSSYLVDWIQKGLFAQKLQNPRSNFPWRKMHFTRLWFTFQLFIKLLVVGLDKIATTRIRVAFF